MTHSIKTAGSNEDMGNYFAAQSMALENLTQKSRANCNIKFNNIYNKSINNIILAENSNTDNNLYNLTNEDIPKEVNKMLSLGPKFALPPKKNEIPFLHVISDLEDLAKSIDNKEKQNECRHKFSNIMTNFSYKSNNIKSHHNTIYLNNLYDETKSYLKERKDMVIIEADKGNRTVIMYKSLYDKTIQKILEDNYTYEKVNYDPTKNIEEKANALVLELYKKNYIKKDQKIYLTTNNSVTPLMYALPKIHKFPADTSLDDINDQLKGRPVISSIGSPLYKLSKFCGNILKKSFKSKYNVKNSREVVERISKITVPKGYVMISLDVESLFTSFPIELILNAVEEQWEEIEQHTCIDKFLFMKIIKLILKSGYFKVNGNFFLQKLGSAMGNSLIPIVIDFGMEKLMDICISYLSYDPIAAFKYVDDTFLVVPEEEVENTLTVFNNYHSHIKFTLETEENQCIPYLDVLLIRSADQQIKTEWYNKPTASNRMINFNSNHSLTQKLNVAYGAIQRICDLTTTKTPKDNLKIIMNILTKNGFPAKLIKKLFHKYNKEVERKQKFPSAIPDENNETNQKKENYKYRSLINIEGLTQKISKSIKQFDKCIKICPRNSKTIKNLYTRVKDSIPTRDQSNLVYSIPCADCNKKYIGITHKQHLKTRIKQHKGDIKTVQNNLKKVRINDSNNIKIRITEEIQKEENSKIPNTTRLTNLKRIDRQSEKSGLVAHHTHLSHKIDFDNAKIIDKMSNKFKLQTLEILHIKTNENMNKKEDTNSLGILYDGILLNITKNIYH